MLEFRYNEFNGLFLHSRNRNCCLIDECVPTLHGYLTLSVQLSYSLEYLILSVLLLQWCWHASVSFIYGPSEVLHPSLTHKFTGHTRSDVMGTQQMSSHSFLATPVIRTWIQFSLAQVILTERNGMLVRWETSWELMLPCSISFPLFFLGWKVCKGLESMPSSMRRNQVKETKASKQTNKQIRKNEGDLELLKRRNSQLLAQAQTWKPSEVCPSLMIT